MRGRRRGSKPLRESPKERAVWMWCGETGGLIRLCCVQAPFTAPV